MNIINDLLETGLVTIAGTSTFADPINIAGNALESTTQNEMLQTAAKILQSINLACLAIWAIVNTSDILNVSWDVIHFAVPIAGALVLSIPLISHLLKNLFPDNKEKIENFQKSYSTAIKIINIMTSSIALGAGIYFAFPIASILLSGVSLLSSAYTLHKNTTIVEMPKSAQI